MELTTSSRFTRDQSKNMIQIYDVVLIDVTGVQYFQLFHLGKTTRNYYAPVTCYHVIPVVI